MPKLGDLSPAGSVAIGIIVGLLSTSIQSIGLTLQRKSHLLEDSKEDDLLRRPAYRRRRWQIGMLLFVVSNVVGSTIQITTLPLPVLSTLQASGLVFNTICASVVLGEPFTRWSFFGTVLVAGGAILIAMFGALPEPSHSLDQLLHLLGRRQFILWMIGTFLFMLLILLIIFLLGRLRPENSARLRYWRGMCFGCMSGILSAHSLLVAKSAVELLVRTIVSHSNQFNRWQSWAILLLLVFFALSQLYFLHRGLKLCSTSILYPFVFCIYNIVAILDGLIYFKQTDRLPPLHAGLIALGTAILLSGVIALSWRLDDDGISPPADAHTLLTPGMGIVEDATTESNSPSSSAPTSPPFPPFACDEESQHSPTEHTPLLPSSSSRRRHRLVSETQDIWSDLQDSGTAQLRFQHIRKHSDTPTSASAHAHNEADNEADNDEDIAHRRIARHKRARTVAGTGIGAGTWRERRRRWSGRYRSASTPVPGRGQERDRDWKRRAVSVAVGQSDGSGDAEGSVEGRGVGRWLVGWWRKWGRKEDDGAGDGPGAQRQGDGG